MGTVVVGDSVMGAIVVGVIDNGGGKDGRSVGSSV